MAKGNRISVSQTQRLRLSTPLQASLRVLRADAAGLACYLEEQAAEIPALTLVPTLPAAGDWLPRWTGILPDPGPGPREAPAHAPSLIAHVLDAIPSLIRPQDHHIALALTEALEPTGWLGRATEVIAAELGVPETEVMAVLHLLQTIEPAGLFARSLTECLGLQAVDAGCLDPVMQTMLGRLDLVASGDWAALARLASAPEADINARFLSIRSFNPKPGTHFAAVASPMREPDLAVRPGPDGWAVSLNRSSLPTLLVAKDATGAAEARAVISMVEKRNTTLIAVARCILAHQRAALEQGPALLRPLGMQAVAEALGLHKSTVSRVVTGTAIDTPHGTWWLRALFSGDMGSDTGAAALRVRLARLIATEDRTAPLSDEALAEALRHPAQTAGHGGTGPQIARRTVAKYRAALRIPPAHRRRIRS